MRLILCLASAALLSGCVAYDDGYGYGGGSYGYDRYGFDRYGYDRSGYNRSGYNRQGRDRKGYYRGYGDGDRNTGNRGNSWQGNPPGSGSNSGSADRDRDRDRDRDHHGGLAGRQTARGFGT